MSWRTLALWILMGTLAGLLSMACAPVTLPALPAPVTEDVSMEAQAEVQSGSADPAPTPVRRLPAVEADTQTARAESGPGPEAGGRANPNNKPLPLMYFEDYGVNPFVDADEDALSTFALDGDTASYAVARRYVRDSWLPPPEAVRIEEFVNAFAGGYSPSPAGLTLHLDAAPAPFAPAGYVLLRVGVAAPAFPLEREPVSLIFIVDISGSMDYDNRLEAAKRIMLGLLEQAAPADRVALVVYGYIAQVRVPLQAAEDIPQLQQAIRRLNTAGVTNAEAGIRLAYELAEPDILHGQKVRLVLFSDGVGNVGETGPDQILDLVDQAAQRLATLTTVGVGISGNYNDVLMERLANRGNGTYHYIEDREAEAEFLAGPAQAVFHETVRDARIQVEFDPDTVRKYRLLGYENRAKPDDSFRDDTEDFGEIGFRSDVTALYEVRPLLAEPQGPMATARLRYRDPLRGEVVERTAALTWESVQAPDRYFQRQLAVAEWAELLGKSFYAQCGSMEAVLAALPPAWDQRSRELEALVRRSLPLWEPFCTE